MNKIAIITDESGWHGKQLLAAFAQRGFETEFVSLSACKLNLDGVNVPIFIPGFVNTLPIAVFVRGVTAGSLEEVVFYLDILHALKHLGIPVYNDATAIERSVDKGMTSFLLQQAGLPTPETWVVREPAQAMEIANTELAQGHFLISKPIFGSQGEGIRRFETELDLIWLTPSNGIYYLQRFVQCNGIGFTDIRVFVIHGEAIAAMRRRGNSWLNNVAKGARCEPELLTDALATLAVQASQSLHMNYAGVDIIQDQQGNYQIIEVNSIPAWKGLESVCKLNIAQLLVDDLLSLVTPNLN